jgi:NAD(P)-dependent dehydrogenase (short-subunit alcohol dehydrogenase family)
MLCASAAGIGRATTELFAAEGWETFAVDRRQVERFPAGVTSRLADVAVPGDVEALFAWLRERTDRLDALVNNAAIQICKPMVEMSVEEWDAVMASNLRSAFLTARGGHRLLQAGRVDCQCVRCTRWRLRRAWPPMRPARAGWLR